MQLIKVQSSQFLMFVRISAFLILFAGLLFLQQYWMYAGRPDVFSASLNLTYQLICILSFLPWVLIIRKAQPWIRDLSSQLWLHLFAHVLVFGVVATGQFFWSSLCLYLADLIPTVYFPRYLAKFMTEWVHVYFLLFAAITIFYWKRDLSKSNSSHTDRLVQRGHIEVKEKGETHLLDFSHIDYIEAIDHYQKLFVGDRFYLTKKSMRALEKDSPTFMVRVHRSFIVNLNHVTSVKSVPAQQQSIVLKDGRIVKVGKTYGKGVVELIRSYQKEEETLKDLSASSR